HGLLNHPVPISMGADECPGYGLECLLPTSGLHYLLLDAPQSSYSRLALVSILVNGLKGMRARLCKSSPLYNIHSPICWSLVLATKIFLLYYQVDINPVMEITN
ncbi:hypothetical protein DSO57_1011236, partial [Entomophthora muscae]